MLLIHEPVGQRATRTRVGARVACAATSPWGERPATQGQHDADGSSSDMASAVRVGHARGQPQTQTQDSPFDRARAKVGGAPRPRLQDVTWEQATAFSHESPAAQWRTVQPWARCPFPRCGLRRAPPVSRPPDGRHVLLNTAPPGDHRWCHPRRPRAAINTRLFPFKAVWPMMVPPAG
jgi:hypothetical protein